MRIVFCGTPQFAVPSLKHLLTQKDFEIVSVYTQPDRPRGRGQEISFSPAKEVAGAGGLEAWGAGKERRPGVGEAPVGIRAFETSDVPGGAIDHARVPAIPG